MRCRGKGPARAADNNNQEPLTSSNRKTHIGDQRRGIVKCLSPQPSGVRHPDLFSLGHPLPSTLLHTHRSRIPPLYQTSRYPGAVAQLPTWGSLSPRTNPITRSSTKQSYGNGIRNAPLTCCRDRRRGVEARAGGASCRVGPTPGTALLIVSTAASGEGVSGRHRAGPSVLEGRRQLVGALWSPRVRRSAMETIFGVALSARDRSQLGVPNLPRSLSWSKRQEGNARGSGARKETGSSAYYPWREQPGQLSNAVVVVGLRQVTHAAEVYLFGAASTYQRLHGTSASCGAG